MMVRLVDPEQGMRVYDPCSGSGGMLILAKEYTSTSTAATRADPTSAGRRPTAPSGRSAKMNMLLHGISDADLRNGRHPGRAPAHVEGGELMRFDRVITNPPFSQNYTDQGQLAQVPERFRYG
jgi:type I restriction enzyme M protein